ncbi:uncharacterized protein LOC128245062 [Mya arenaria]|uniref:uncharacterized protein LOC128245062 n=1 Tax=Mya arenaria TaxID=6604 RepID=UPI0022DEB264|nr:uncharacterized protein LOC128245062 [Mya arenaria]
MSRRRRTLFEEYDGPVAHITVYKYGAMFTPVERHKQNSKHNISTQILDRPAIISKIYHLLSIHRQKTEEALQQNKILKQCHLKPCHDCSSSLHIALQKAIRLCYNQKIGESRLYPVGELFLELFHCGGDTSALFSPLLDANLIRRSHSGNEILYPKKDAANIHITFEYYLNHVCNINTTVISDSQFAASIKNTDLINKEIGHNSGILPLSAAIHKRDPAFVLILLRYGADPFHSLEANSSSYEDHIRNPTENVIDDLNGLFLFKNTAFSDNICAQLAAEEAKVWTCLTYIRRAVPGIDLTSCTHIITSSGYDSDDKVNEPRKPVPMGPKYNLLPKLADKIDLKFFKKTSSLKQLCRCVVRQKLQANCKTIGSIPKGINLLPLPRLLKDYLDLQTD